MHHLFHRSVAIVTAAALAVASAAPALADAKPQDKTMAVGLFKEGKALMDKGDYAGACPKFEAATKYDPAADGILLNWAICLEGLGKYATAWAYFAESVGRAKSAGRADREKVAQQHIAAIEPKLSHVTINVAPAARVDGLAVTWDGQSLATASWGVAVPVDPGPHHLVASAPSRRTWETDVTVGTTADSKLVEVPALEPEGVPAAGAVVPTHAEHPSPAPMTQTGSESKPLTGSRTGGWVLVGAGGVLVVGAIGSFFLAKSAQSDRKSFCESQLAPTCPDDDSKSRIHRWETVSYVTGALGIAAATVGIVLLSRNHPSDGSSTQVQVGSLGAGPGIQVSGTF